MSQFRGLKQIKLRQKTQTYALYQGCHFFWWKKLLVTFPLASFVSHEYSCFHFRTFDVLTRSSLLLQDLEFQKKTSKTSFETPEKNSLLLTNFATHKLFPDLEKNNVVPPPRSKVYFHRLRPNIRTKILHTDLHTFPYKISWENQSTFPLVTIFTLITFGSSLLRRGGLMITNFHNTELQC